MLRMLALILLALSTSVHATETKMFEKMKTYCIGRYLVDVPVEAEMLGWRNSYALGAIGVGFGVPKFRELVKETLEKRKNQQGKRSFKFVRTEYPEEGDRQDRQIIISQADLYGSKPYEIDAFTLNPRGIPGGGYFFYLFSKVINEKNLDEMIERYKTVLSNVRYRPDSEIPKEPGFCFKDGFVANDGKNSQTEENRVRFRLKNNPDVIFLIYIDVPFVESPSILERKKEAKLEERFPGKIKTILSGKREINGMPGEEVAATFPAEDKTGSVHDFVWETLGELDNPLKPYIRIDIESGYDATGMGGATASSLEAKDMLKLYESIVKTIRIRPVTENPSDGKTQPQSSPPAPKPEAQAPQASPLRLATGEPCTRTGMWRCVEDGKVVTYHEGRFMPTAYFFKPATGWLNRLKGVKSVFSHQGPGHWEWVGELPEVDGEKG
ncbi:MAG: T6SS immunity protein Tli4 family protein [Proteobacteria bacterium]|nr:T6SS immunity protein Tli4 family protein [Pseudomonadota bacterium]